MWFKNLCAWRLQDAAALSDPEALAEALAGRPFQACAPLASESIGWVAPAPTVHDGLLHSAGGRHLLCARIERKLLPAAVVREFAEDEIRALAEREGRAVRAAERREIRDRITTELLPRAFTRSQRQLLLIDTAGGWLMADCSSAARAEQLTALLRETLGSLALRPLLSEVPPRTAFGQWLAETAVPSAGFSLGDECELQSPGEDGAVVRVRRIEQPHEDIQRHLHSGMQVSKLALDWDERVTLLLADDLICRRLRYSDALDSGADNADEAAQFDADFALMSDCLAGLLQATLAALGGEAGAAAPAALDHTPTPA